MGNNNLLTQEQFSYLYGLFGTDGSWVKRNGKIIGLQIELSEKDRDILEYIHELIPLANFTTRTRNTNFLDNYTCCSLKIGKMAGYSLFLEAGMPTEEKTNNIKPPLIPYDEKAFWRGVIDGDGSIGYRKRNNVPFVSLVTKSEELKQSYCDFIYRTTGKKFNVSRNKRDNVYNLDVSGKRCIMLCKILYTDSTIALTRKKTIAEEIIKNNDTRYGGLPL